MDPFPLFVLLVVSFVASTLSSLAGFGGSLLVLPVLVHLVGPAEAVPTFTIAALMGNAARAWFGRSVIDWIIVRRYLTGAVPGAALGAVIFVAIPPEWAQRTMAVFMIAMMFIQRHDAGRPWPPGAIVAAGGGSALLSGVFGFSGPISAAIFFAQGLSPAGYIASEACSAMAVHAVKTLAYGRLDAVTLQTVWLGSVLGGTMWVGAWLARRWIDRIPVHRYRWAVRTVFIATACSLLLA